MQNPDSLVAAIEGDFNGMSHADLVLSCQMLTRGRAEWKKECEQAQKELERWRKAASPVTDNPQEDDDDGRYELHMCHCESCGRVRKAIYQDAHTQGMRDAAEIAKPICNDFPNCNSEVCFTRDEVQKAILAALEQRRTTRQ
jgi:hypothetical protein